MNKAFVKEQDNDDDDELPEAAALPKGTRNYLTPGGYAALRNELIKLIETVDGDVDELIELREKRYVMMDKIKGLRKSIREINTSLNTTKNLIGLMDDQIKEMLDSETTELVESNFSLFDDWWNQNIEPTNDDSMINVTDLWFKFKQENKDVLKEFDISVDKFKQFLKTKIPISCIITKNKNVNSSFDIKGFRIKEMKEFITETVEDAKNMDSDNENIATKPPKKVRKSKIS